MATKTKSSRGKAGAGMTARTGAKAPARRPTKRAVAKRPPGKSKRADDMAQMRRSLDRLLALVEAMDAERRALPARAASPVPDSGATRSRAARAPSGEALPAGASTAELGERLAEIEASIVVLAATARRLERMPAAEVEALELRRRQQRARALSEALFAIEDLENAKLAALNEAFEARRAELHAATRQLAVSLERIEGTIAFIEAAAAAVKIVADVLTLIR